MGPSPPETSPTPHHLILNEHIQTRQTLRPKTATITSLFSRLFGTFAAPSPAAMSAAKTKAQGLVNENAVGSSSPPPSMEWIALFALDI